MELSGGLEAVPVAVAPGPRGETPAAFEYSPESVAGADGELDPCEVTLPGCSCRSPCRAPSCPCLSRGSPAPEQQDQQQDQQQQDQQQEEQDQEQQPRFCRPVFECSALCPCGDSCPGRRLQGGLRLPLQVFLTARKGWGVRTLRPVPRGAFVCEYAGEVLGAAEARRRLEAQGPAQPNYILALREHLHGGTVLRTFVDPTRVGNVGRFLNHSCEPNLVMVPVRLHSMVPRLALVAARDIPAGEELCYDYSGRFQNAPAAGREHGPVEEEDGPRKPCYCGSPSCASFLPWDGSLFSTPGTSP